MVQNDVVPIIREDWAHLKSKDFQHPLLRASRFTKLARRQEYSYQVFMRIAAIFSAFERLEELWIYLKNKNLIEMFRNLGVTQDKWIEYHFTNHVTTSLTIFEICLLLTNEVLQLGLNPRDCRAQIMLRHTWVKRLGINKLLKKIEKQISHHKDLRHGILHRGEVPSMDVVFSTEQYRLLQMYATAVRCGIDITPVEDAYNEAFQAFTSTVLERLEAECRTLANSLLPFFSALSPLYKERRDALQR